MRGLKISAYKLEIIYHLWLVCNNCLFLSGSVGIVNSMKTIKYASYIALSLIPNIALAESSGSGAAAGAVIGIFFIFIAFFYMLFFAVAIAAFVFWIIMLVDVAQRTNWENENDKTVWVLIVVLTGGIGALIYYFMVRKKLGPNHPVKKG